MSSSSIIYSWNISIRKGLYSTSSNSTLIDCINLTIIANSLDEARKNMNIPMKIHYIIVVFLLK